MLYDRLRMTGVFCRVRVFCAASESLHWPCMPHSACVMLLACFLLRSYSYPYPRIHCRCYVNPTLRPSRRIVLLHALRFPSCITAFRNICRACGWEAWLQLPKHTDAAGMLRHSCSVGLGGCSVLSARAFVEPLRSSCGCLDPSCCSDGFVRAPASLFCLPILARACCALSANAPANKQVSLCTRYCPSARSWQSKLIQLWSQCDCITLSWHWISSCFLFLRRACLAGVDS